VTDVWCRDSRLNPVLAAFVDALTGVDEGRVVKDLEGLSPGEVTDLGRDAAEAVTGAVRGRDLLGADRLDTAGAGLLLGVSRQALHKAVRAGRLLGVPGRGTTSFPAWQFTPDRRVRPVVREVLAAFASDGVPADPWAVLSWSATGQPELADWRPGEWIADGRPDGPVLAAAGQAARALAA